MRKYLKRTNLTFHMGQHWSFRGLAVGVVMILCLSQTGALASSSKKSEAPQAEPHCGMLESFEGELQFFDSSRKHLLQQMPKMILPCNTWVSTHHGWAKIRHVKGPVISVGGSTLIKIASLPEVDPQLGDHLILYKGQVYLDVKTGSEEFRLVTPSARSRFTDAKAIMIYNSDKNQTQLITLEKSALIENRFQVMHRAKVQAGEASALDPNLLRVAPSIPRAISASSLSSKFTDLQLSDEEQTRAIKTVLVRQKKVYAADILDGTLKSEPEKSLHSDSKASSEQEDANLVEHFVKKLTGGAPVGKAGIHPEKNQKRTGLARVHVLDSSHEHRRSGQLIDQEQMEKKRLIHELSNIKSD